MNKSNPLKPNLRARLLASLTRYYPMLSGRGSIANHSLFKKLTGKSDDLVWAPCFGAWLLVPLNDFIGRTVYFTGDLDAKITALARHAIEPGDIALDIGANLGVVSTMLSYFVGDKGKVYAFEPNLAIAQIFERSIQKNPRKNIDLHQIALGAEETTLTLHVPIGGAQEASFVRQNSSYKFKEVGVPVYTLANFASEHGIDHIDFIKIDVEGFEYQVLLGAETVLKSLKPTVIVLEENSGTDADIEPPPVRLLRELNYDIFGIKKTLFKLRLLEFSPRNRKRFEMHDLVAISKHEKSRAMRRALRLG